MRQVDAAEAEDDRRAGCFRRVGDGEERFEAPALEITDRIAAAFRLGHQFDERDPGHGGRQRGRAGMRPALKAAARSSSGRSIAIRSIPEPSWMPWQRVRSSMNWPSLGPTMAAPWASRMTSGLMDWARAK